MCAPMIRVTFHTPYVNAAGEELEGDYTLTAADTFSPVTSAAGEFTLKGVTIGVGFHWERREDQRFKGALRLVTCPTGLQAINVVDVEEYLKSVISSEMKAQASIELLKAHAVISRSWLLSQIEAHNRPTDHSCDEFERIDTDCERVMWYDHDDHDLFDVCADDHCQRYQGVTRVTEPRAVEAVEATRGKVLIDKEGNICDARFSKCCGGVFELFENCWEPVHHHYLEAGRDSADTDDYPDLSIERNAEEWILGKPKAFCNTTDAEVLDQVLNDYDRETPDFYRWHVSYTRQELADLIHRRSGIDFGDIIDLVPDARGTSGRLYRLEIIGTRHSMMVGKELEIRRWLSESHLYSSAFVVERRDIDADGIPGLFVLHGAGWGHGVGLCQIGAAMMAHQGSDYEEILMHYYHGASIDHYTEAL